MRQFSVHSRVEHNLDHSQVRYSTLYSPRCQVGGRGSREIQGERSWEFVRYPPIRSVKSLSRRDAPWMDNGAGLSAHDVGGGSGEVAGDIVPLRRGGDTNTLSLGVVSWILVAKSDDISIISNQLLLNAPNCRRIILEVSGCHSVQYSVCRGGTGGLSHGGACLHDPLRPKDDVREGGQPPREHDLVVVLGHQGPERCGEHVGGLVALVRRVGGIPHSLGVVQVEPPPRIRDTVVVQGGRLGGLCVRVGHDVVLC
mmetsp:Transcript_24654/g.58245  ORF Transcript_24654/g.58245 Transcript_24654/m.58245 type:complete len:255 (+) Transcript_24654:400-1164(+)